MNSITFSDILIKPQYSEVLSRSNVDLTSDMGKFKLSLPVISANMRHITGPKMAQAIGLYGGLGDLHRCNTIEEAVDEFHASDPNHKINVGVSIGVKEEDKERFDKLYEAGARIFTITIFFNHTHGSKFNPFAIKNIIMNFPAEC